MTALAVAVGGAFGAVMRYFVLRLTREMDISLYVGTFTVNVVGSLMLGIMVALIEERGLFSVPARSAITIGFIGGLTTFSTFVYEYWQFFREGEPLKAFAYITLSLVLSLAAFIAGHEAAIAAS